MIKRNKWLLGFSVVYWLAVVLGVVLNALALQKVPLESYGLRAYFFNPVSTRSTTPRASTTRTWGTTS